MVIAKGKLKLVGLILVLIFLVSLAGALDNQTSTTNNTTKTTTKILASTKTITDNQTKKQSNQTKTTKSSIKKTTTPVTSTRNSVQEGCVYYFYGTDCVLCSKTDTLIDQIKRRNSKLKIEKFEIYYNKSNRQLLQDYFNKYEIDLNRQGIPVVFLPNSYFIGPKAITQFLEGAIATNTDASCPDLSGKEMIGIIGQKSPKNLIETLTFSKVTGGAFTNSVNLCALGLLSILLLLFLAQKNRRKLIGTGFTFVIGIYLAYLLAGIGVLSPVSAKMGYYFYKVIGVIAILVGIYLFKKRFWPKAKLIKQKLPEKIKKVLTQTIKVSTSFMGALVLGLIASLFQISCNQGIYKVLLDLVADKTTKTTALPLLLFHNFIFILYLILVTLIIGYSMKRKESKKGKLDIPDGLESKFKSNYLALHFFIGIVLFILGLIILFTI